MIANCFGVAYWLNIWICLALLVIASTTKIKSILLTWPPPSFGTTPGSPPSTSSLILQPFYCGLGTSAKCWLNWLQHCLIYHQRVTIQDFRHPIMCVTEWFVWVSPLPFLVLIGATRHSNVSMSCVNIYYDYWRILLSLDLIRELFICMK